VRTLFALAPPTPPLRGFADWLANHPGAVATAGLLAFAAPVTLFTGALSVMAQRDASQVLELAAWWLFYGLQFWALLLLAGHVGERLCRHGSAPAAMATWLVLGCVSSGWVNATTAGRADMLIEQGVVQSAVTMQLYSFILSLTLSLLYFAHLGRSRRQEQAVARLVAAQASQRAARRSMVEVRLQAVQARIDPQLLFAMLEAVRVAYLADAARAERLLDDLIAFLRACLPRVAEGTSSVSREADLARAYVRLQALVHASDDELLLQVSHEAMHSRFPPGVLLPLLADALGARFGPCSLRAELRPSACELHLVLPQCPAQDALLRARALLEDLYGASAALVARSARDAAHITLRVPHEPA
jgi:hypothetical protein